MERLLISFMASTWVDSVAHAVVFGLSQEAIYYGINGFSLELLYLEVKLH